MGSRSVKENRGPAKGRLVIIAIDWETVDVNSMVEEPEGIDIGVGSGASTKITLKKNWPLTLVRGKYFGWSGFVRHSF